MDKNKAAADDCLFSVLLLIFFYSDLEDDKDGEKIIFYDETDEGLSKAYDYDEDRKT